MKKKLLAVLLTMTIGTGLLAGCGAKQEDAKPADEQTQEETTGTDEQEETVDLSGKSLMIFCGAGMTNPFQEIADAFQDETGCEMNVTFANAGQIQSQITTAEEGDLFIAGSVEELEPVSDYVTEQKNLVKHIPVLAVAADNPKEITGLASLAQPDIITLIGDPEATPIGKIAKKALTEAGIFDQVTIGATTSTAPQLATAVASGEGDAAIVWKENCKADGVEIVDTTDLDKYVKTVPAAELKCTADQDTLTAFYDYLNQDSVKQIWEKYGYEIAEK